MPFIYTLETLGLKTQGICFQINVPRVYNTRKHDILNVTQRLGQFN